MIVLQQWGGVQLKHLHLQKHNPDFGVPPPLFCAQERIFPSAQTAPTVSLLTYRDTPSFWSFMLKESGVRISPASPPEGKNYPLNLVSPVSSSPALYHSWCTTK